MSRCYHLAYSLQKVPTTCFCFAFQETDLDLEMLAPYIPMDDDFQLRSFDQLSPLESGSTISPPSATTVAGFQPVLPPPAAPEKISPLTARPIKGDLETFIAPLHITIESKSAPASPYMETPSRTAPPSKEEESSRERNERSGPGAHNLLTVALGKR